MNLFRKNNNDKSVNGDYLKSADTVGRPAAALYVIIIVLVISAVVFSLFISGKWIYNTVSSKDKSNTSQKDENKTVDNPTTENSSNNSNNTDQNTNAPGTTSQSQITPAPVQTPTKIPNTGPQDE